MKPDNFTDAQELTAGGKRRASPLVRKIFTTIFLVMIAVVVLGVITVDQAVRSTREPRLHQVRPLEEADNYRFNFVLFPRSNDTDLRSSDGAPGPKLNRAIMVDVKELRTDTIDVEMKVGTYKVRVDELTPFPTDDWVTSIERLNGAINHWGPETDFSDVQFEFVQIDGGDLSVRLRVNEKNHRWSEFAPI